MTQIDAIPELKHSIHFSLCPWWPHLSSPSFIYSVQIGYSVFLSFLLLCKIVFIVFFSLTFSGVFLWSPMLTVLSCLKGFPSSKRCSAWFISRYVNLSSGFWGCSSAYRFSISINIEVVDLLSGDISIFFQERLFLEIVFISFPWHDSSYPEALFTVLKCRLVFRKAAYLQLRFSYLFSWRIVKTFVWKHQYQKKRGDGVKYSFGLRMFFWRRSKKSLHSS